MDEGEFRFASRMSGLSGSAIREIFKHTAKPGIISFAGGNPGSFALPNEEIAAIAESLLRSRGKVLLQYGQTEGYPPLREALPQYIEDEFAVSSAADQLLVTTGSMQGLDLLCKTLIDPGDVILCESPAFLGALQCMHSYEARLVPISSDKEGLDVLQLEAMMREHHPKLLYVIPTFQNPSGVTLSLARRQTVAQLAARYGVVVAEDDPYHALRYRGQTLPAIKSFDVEGWVVLLGSFSKVIAPGLRVGFMAGDRSLLRRCAICKQGTDVHTANLDQAIVDSFLREGLLAPHIAGILPAYASRMDIMQEALSEMSGLSGFTEPEGGLFLFAALEEGQDAAALFQRAIQRGVAFVPGEPFFPEGGHSHTFRLNFSNASEGDIRRGMAILGDCINETRI
ncbi:MAG: PLP-dependent aminotransferase family protein [Christensenellales bacterium]